MVREALELLWGILKGFEEFKAVRYGLGVGRHEHVDFNALEQLLITLAEGVHLVIEAGLV